ncbi:M15 family metallopeptidase [Thermithiobacillus plumbiphilus]|uniref:M15 family metallopeptidase n=1 Tax=Thermithiobacillus plumbiphilus TaxID=1729899 RepID=A0ABU9D7H4_9PROT
MLPAEYLIRVTALLDELGMPAEYIVHRQLPLFFEPAELVLAEAGPDGREYLLTPEAVIAWRQLSAAAAQDGVLLSLASAFRSLGRQADIIRRKQSLGLSLEQILSASAPPGYSEHHTGRAIDIATPGCPPFEEAFESTEAFGWLSKHAGSFGFTLSYPRGNKYGYVFEPWHWCYCAEDT